MVSEELNEYVKSTQELLVEMISDIDIIDKDLMIELILKRVESFEDSDSLFDVLINKYLKKIINYNLSKKEILYYIDVSSDFLENFNDSYEIIVSEVNLVCEEIILKLIGYNGRVISYPVDVYVIKNYFVSSIIFFDELNLLLVFFCFKLMLICNLRENT